MRKKALRVLPVTIQQVFCHELCKICTYMNAIVYSASVEWPCVVLLYSPYSFLLDGDHFLHVKGRVILRRLPKLFSTAASRGHL